MSDVMDMKFDPGNKSANAFDMDQFKLDHRQKARISLLDEAPKCVLAHWVWTGVADDGKSHTGKYFVCKGDYATVMRNRRDNDNCPACKEAQEGRDVPVSMPRRRFAMHILRYYTNQQADIIEPISMGLQVFVYADDKFSVLTDRAKVHGDLRKKDLVVTCSGGQWRKYDFDVAPETLWASSKPLVEQYKKLQAQRSPEIAKLLGSVVSTSELEGFVSNATPTVGATDRPIAKGVGDALAAMAQAGQVEIDDAVFGENDRPAAPELAEPVLAGVVASDDILPSVDAEPEVVDLSSLLD